MPASVAAQLNHLTNRMPRNHFETMNLLRSAQLTSAWFALLAAFFRWWDMTTRASAVTVWTLVFAAAFAATVLIFSGREALRRGPERVRLLLWLALAVLAGIGSLAIPTVQIGEAMVHTRVFVAVLDTVLPLWIMVRALMLLWRGWARVAAVASLPLLMATGLWFFVIAMPGSSAGSDLPRLTAAESSLAAQLERDVRRLADEIGERHHARPEALRSAADYIAAELRAAGHHVELVPFRAAGREYVNIEATIAGAGSAGEVLVIGAHYDSAEGAPGADDNASGTAALLALARSVAGRTLGRTVRLVAFANEEPPFFNGPDMGSRHYAEQAAARGDDIRAMISLETVGYYSDEPGSQRYPPPLNWFYPDRGNFIGFVGNMDSRALVRSSIAAFRRTATLPSEGAAAPALLPGISWSDHQEFWRFGWKAIMISDTAPFRNPHYHQRTDTADHLDYGRMARLVVGLVTIVEELAGPPAGR